jgi:hypothetical protein
MSREIRRIENGYFIAYKDGNSVGVIATEHGDGAIAQHSIRRYNATFRPNPNSQGISTSGTLSQCKKWMTAWIDMTWPVNVD